ncbi:MAG: right-handed parallel beta-helix repeat-containing protein, partial [Alphaproteobacteria bacterium]
SGFTGLKKTAVHFEGNGQLRVKGSRFEAVKGAVVVLKGAGAVSILGNWVTNATGKGYAIVSESTGKVVIANNRIIKAPNGIQVSGTFKTAAKIANNLLVNVQRRGISLQAKAAGGDIAVRVSGNRIVAAGDTGVFLNKSPKAALADNLILSKGKYGIFMQHGSSVRLSGNVMAGAKGALFAHSSAAAGSTAGDDIFIGGMQPKRAVRARPAGTKIAFLTGGKKTQARFRKLANAVLAAAGTAPAADVMAKVETASTALMEQAKTIRARAESLATVALKATDLLGREFSTGYSVYDANGKKVAKDILNPVTVVKPGTYIIEPYFDTSLARDITVGAGESKSVKITSKRHLVFRFSSPRSSGTMDMPLVLKSRRDLRRALAAYRAPFSVYDIAVMRKSATAKQRADALSLARAVFRKLNPRLIAVSRELEPLEKKPYNKRTDLEKKAFNKASSKRYALQSEFILPAKILAAVGTGADARRLAEAAAKTSVLMGRRIAVAAYIENRLGSLGTGAVAAAVRGNNRALALHAALKLHSFGFDAGDAVLVEYLKSAKDATLAGAAAQALLDTPRADVLAAMRGIIDIALKAQTEKGNSGAVVYTAKAPAALYLLTHGGKADRKRVAKLKMYKQIIPHLTLATTDPSPMIDYLLLNITGNSARTARRRIGQWSGEFAELCPMFRLLPWRKRARMEKAIERAFVSVGMKFRISGRTSNSDRLSSRTFHSVDVGQCRATGSAASIVYKRTDVFYRSKTWIPTPWATAKAFKTKWYWNNRRLDYVPHADVVKGVNKHHAKDDGKRDIFLAYHAIATNAEILGSDRQPDGADRRAFILVNKANPPGALAAVVSMRPELIGDRLRVSLAFDLASHTQSSLALMMDPPTRSFERYLASRGKSIIKRLFLRRGDRTIAMTPAKDDGKGNFAFEATLKNRSLGNLDLHVELQVFETVWPLRFGLYASDYARKLNRAETRLAATAKSAQARPGDLRALVGWGHALQGTGRLDAARAKYQKALALKPQDVNLWFTLSDMYANRGLYGDAAKILQKAVVALPKNGDLGFELANNLYRSGAYGAAAVAFGKLAILEPKNVRWKWWQATNQFLAGDRRAAISFFRGTKTKYQRRRTALLRYIAAKLGGSAGDIAAAEAQMKTQLKGREKTIEGSLYGLYARMIAPTQVFKSARTPAQQCQAHVYVGYGQLVDGKKKEARKRLQAALEVCGANKLEYRLAEAELGRLGTAK